MMVILNIPWLRATGFPLVALMLLVACGNADPEADAAEEVQAAADRPGVRQLDSGRYEVVIHAYDWGWEPSEIRVPAGAEVTFRTRSRDNPHALYVLGTDVRFTVVRGEFREATHTFDEPGEYPFVCDEYCGGGHDAMRGRVIVE